MRSRTIEPMTARMKLPKLKPVTVPKPRAVPSQPPITAPTMPMMIVMMMPPGSRPGMMSLATAPAIRPKMIQAIQPICVPSRCSDQSTRRGGSLSEFRQVPPGSRGYRASLFPFEHGETDRDVARMVLLGAQPVLARRYRPLPNRLRQGRVPCEFLRDHTEPDGKDEVAGEECAEGPSGTVGSVD